MIEMIQVSMSPPNLGLDPEKNAKKVTRVMVTVRDWTQFLVLA